MICSDCKDAMANAIADTIVSVTGSSLTTVAGFLAMCFMTFTLGLDMGIVMAKGVVIGVICCVTVLPSLILVFDKGVKETEHKALQLKTESLPDYLESRQANQALDATADPTNMAYAGYIRSMIATYKGLYDNVAAVQNGVSALSTGYGEIDTGIGTVASSVNQVADAVDQLSNGAVSLAAGTLELKDGVVKFDEEGIQKLSELIENDLEGYFDRLKAIQEYADEYTSFGGCLSAAYFFA